MVGESFTRQGLTGGKVYKVPRSFGYSAIFMGSLKKCIQAVKAWSYRHKGILKSSLFQRIVELSEEETVAKTDCLLCAEALGGKEDDFMIQCLVHPKLHVDCALCSRTSKH